MPLSGSVVWITGASSGIGAATARELARRALREDLRADVDLPDATRLWAALTRASGGVWSGCVYDVERIEQLLAAGEQALADDAAPAKTRRACEIP